MFTTDRIGDPMSAQEQARYYLSRPELLVGPHIWKDLVRQLLTDSERLEREYENGDIQHKRIVALERVLREARDLLEGYVDVRDSGMGPVANPAMQAQVLIDEVLTTTKEQ
jgi:hypothetical protein